MFAGVDAYELSADGKKLLVRKTDAIYVFDAGAKAPDKLDKAKLPLAGWTFTFDPRIEWRQMFTEAWRLERDYFYDRGMNGVDWKAQLEKFRPLAERVTTRGELADVFQQMIGELSALHMYVYGGDLRRGPDQADPASLGARLVRDERAGGFRVDHVPHRPGRTRELRRSRSPTSACATGIWCWPSTARPPARPPTRGHCCAARRASRCCSRCSGPGARRAT